MKILKMLQIIFFITVSLSFLFSQKKDFPILSGPYLGQKPPGTKPEVFAPGIISTAESHEFSCCFSPGGKEFYFNRGREIYISRWQKKGWTEPEPMKFGGNYFDKEPHITADNKILYFGSKRPQPGNENSNAKGIWMVKREGKEWGEPHFVGPGNYVSTALSGNIYITDDSGSNENWHIVKTKLVNGHFIGFERQTGGMVSPSPGHFCVMQPCVSPDERFIIFTAYRKGEWGKSCDLFVCFRQENGSWGKAQLLGEEINTGFTMIPSLSPDGKYLFFYSKHDIYWVDAKIIEQLKRE